MTLQNHLLLITTQPLLLRLSIVALLVFALVAVDALMQRLRRFRESSRNASTADSGHDRPRRIIGTVLYD